jgi:hypothetical protein
LGGVVISPKPALLVRSPYAVVWLVWRIVLRGGSNHFDRGVLRSCH